MWTVVTAGIYRFWYITDLRRYFWSRTLIDGSPACYLGRGKELLVGVVVAIGTLMVLQFAWVGFQSLTSLPPTVGVLAYPIFLLLAHFALYRGRRYRARRTAWRGIRLDQDGSALLYAVIALGWWVVVLATLGLAFPFMRASLERYRMRHTLLGTRRFESTARSRRLLGPWLVLWAVILSPLALMIGMAVTAKICVVSLHGILATSRLPPFRIEPALLDPCFLAEVHGARILGLGFSSALLIAPLLAPYYRAREIRVFLSAIRLDEARMNSTLTAGDYYRPYFKWLTQIYKLALVILIVVIIFILFCILTKELLDHNIRLIIAILALVYFGYYYFSRSALQYVQFLSAGQWKAVAGSVTIVNVDLLETLVPAAAADRGLGEGLADALDPGGAFEVGL